ncbi:unnamed protein product [Microthlaspi erraticum]|uniref:RNA-directed DNA polymerase n=1 Tax=Microthlaspi erraticum TaxID=1685480 RepID=A0A6D2KNX8_9BRAS|nr:unnamed protein product [Microthlaspi erraticum]
MLITEDCSLALQNKTPEKLDDPGSFVLSCQIGGTIFKRCLCDLGSSVNLMPYTVAKRLGITSFRPTKIQLVFADRSVRRPIGIVSDVQVMIGKCFIPADFVVLELDQEPRDPLILGRPFLATAGAIIDVKGGKIDLHLGDLVMKFQIDKTLEKPTIDGFSFLVDNLSEVSEGVYEELIMDDPLEVALTRVEKEGGYFSREARDIAKSLDNAETYKNLVAYVGLEEEVMGTNASRDASKPSKEPWSELSAPKVELKELPVGLRYAFLGPNNTYPVIINSNLSNVETALLLCELRKHRKALGYTLEDITGISPELCMHRIHLEDESKSSIEHQRRLNPNLKDVVKKEIMKLLEAGVIYPISDSTWVSPVHVVPKKGGVTVIRNENEELIPTRTITGHRMCIDYRKLNAATRKDHFPLPFIDQMLERLANHPYYCFLDGYSGFFQIPIHPDDQEKTTFTCPYGTFAYRRMPFGLCNAPATFQRCMMSIFTDYIEDIMEVFMDDFSVYGTSFDVCLSNLSKVLKRCEEKHLVLNWEKCHFMVRDGIVLGHRISERGIEVDKAKIEVMVNLEPPKNVKDGECLAAFKKIKEALISAPIVQSPDWELPFEIMCDASDYAVGAVLGQRKEKKLHVIYYASRTLDEAQCNYATTEKELLAIVFAFEKFRSYLVGSKVIVHTDHAALKYLLSKKDAKPRLIRWILLLQEFDLKIIDRKGAENGVADHLSRMRIEESIPIDDSLPEETVYAVSAVPMSRKETPPKATTERRNAFGAPWYRHIANYLAADIEPPNFYGYKKKKFLKDIRFYFWDEPYLYKKCQDGLFRKCVPEEEIAGILHGCHGSAYAGHFATFKTVSKVLQAGFWWPTMFKDAQAFISRCDACQRMGNISKRNEMPQNFILEVEVFDVWGIDFMGPFPTSFGDQYILVAVDYVSKWVEAIAAPTNDSSVNAFKTPLGTTPFHLVYGKACHLPVELEYKAAWAVKELNFNLKTAAERRLIQLNELEEIRHLAYENTKIYKEKTKALHDRKIVPKSFAANDQVLLFNSRLKLFPGKLRSRWSGPFKIKEVKPYGAVVLWDPSGGDFTVNGQRLKPYLANSEKGIEEIIPLADAPQE